MTSKWIKPVFIVAALYDGMLGVAFLSLGLSIFRMFGVEPPNHIGYVQFPALLLLMFAVMFYRIARDPAGQRSLIPYGIWLKVAYSGSVFWNQLTGGVPFMWIPFAWADLVFLVLFAMAWKQIGGTRL